MKPVMAGDHAEAEVVAFRAPFAVDADPGPLQNPAPPPQRQVGGAKRADERQQVLDRLIGRVEAVDPKILVVSQQRRLVVGEDPSVSPAHGYLGVGDVGNASQHRPFPRGRDDPKVGTGHYYQGPKGCRGRLLDRSRIVNAEQTKQVALVGSGLIDRIGGGGGFVHRENLVLGTRQPSTARPGLDTTCLGAYTCPYIIDRGIYMAVKSDRLEARVSPEQRARLEWAARLAGTSVSAFVVDAALGRAEELMGAQMSTSVPADYFDRLVTTLDQADRAPTLAKAARRVERRPRIASR